MEVPQGKLIIKKLTNMRKLFRVLRSWFKYSDHIVIGYSKDREDYCVILNLTEHDGMFVDFHNIMNDVIKEDGKEIIKHQSETIKNKWK